MDIITNPIDILEDNINQLSPELLNILLKDHTMSNKEDKQIAKKAEIDD